MNNKTRYENSLFYQIQACSKCFSLLFEQLFKQMNFEISATEHLFLIVVEDLKKCCQRDVAKIILKDRASTGKLAQSLEKKGLIKISLETKSNRPVKMLELTSKGKKLTNKISNLLKPIVIKLQKKYTNEFLEEMRTGLIDFRQNVEKIIKTNI